MFWKKIISLMCWYLAWSMVNSYFSNNKSKKFKNNLDSANWSVEYTIKALFDNFIDTHKNVYLKTKNYILSKENLSFLDNKKVELYTLIDTYKDEFENFLDNLKDKSKSSTQFSREKLENLYIDTKKQIDDIKEFSPLVLDDFKTKLSKSFSDLKKKINK